MRERSVMHVGPHNGVIDELGFDAAFRDERIQRFGQAPGTSGAGQRQLVLAAQRVGVRLSAQRLDIGREFEDRRGPASGSSSSSSWVAPLVILGEWFTRRLGDGGGRS
jgi:hypothetical protein